MTDLEYMAAHGLVWVRFDNGNLVLMKRRDGSKITTDCKMEHLRPVDNNDEEFYRSWISPDHENKNDNRGENHEHRSI